MRSKILFVVDYYQPKLGYGSYYIPKSLAKLGNEVTILTSNFYYPFPKYEETAGKILGPRELKISDTIQNKVRVVRVKLIAEIFTRAIFGGQLKYLKEIKPEIVIVDKTASYQAIVFSFLKPFFKYRLVSIDAHLPSGFKAEGNQLAKEIFYFFFRILFSNLINRTVDKFIAVQEKTKIIMRKYYGVTKKIKDIPLGTDLDLFKFDIKSCNSIRKKYSILKDDFLIIYTGKVIKEKGVDLLFSALNILSAKKKNIKLMIVGTANSEYEKTCLSKLDKRYLNKVIWAGFQPAKDLYKYYSASDVGVWPLQESMSMNDIASCGKPFIANNTIGARLRLSNNNALLYKKNDYKDLAKKIMYLYQNKKVTTEMGQRGRELMETKLSWDSIAKQYIAF